MGIKDDIKWFKANFASAIVPALAGTPLSLDLLTAIALQETGEIWRKTRHTHSKAEVLRLCVGDTLDRNAFPRNKAALLAVENGQAMFDLAHELLGEMARATQIQAYLNLVDNPKKFVHGYGIFQLDLQFFKEDPEYFLGQKWKSFDASLSKCLGELKRAIRQIDNRHGLGLAQKSSLTELESAFVAIVYNTGIGNFDPDHKFKQGHEDDGVFYGEHIRDFLRLSKTVPTPTAVLTGDQHPLLPAMKVATPAAAIRSYYPHWTAENGELTEAILDRLPKGTILGLHHQASTIEDILGLLRHENEFQIGWYIECNLLEPSEGQLTVDRVPISQRIREAAKKQRTLIDDHHVDVGRFSGLMELDAAREKAEGFGEDDNGNSLEIEGNKPADFMRDARHVKDAGFLYHGKNMSADLVARLRAEWGDGFVPRLVTEDVTGKPTDENPGYGADAKELADDGHIMTLVVHKNRLGGFPGTTFDKAKSIIDDAFDFANVEAIWGSENSVRRIKSFASAMSSAFARRVHGPAISMRALATPATAALPGIVQVALREFDTYHGIKEGQQPLRGHIADYYRAAGGSPSLDPTLNKNAWSAAFVSWCMKQSGATAAQFKFAMGHWVFVRAAIRNADQGAGVVRGHPIGDYAPQLGDLIHANRLAGMISFEEARDAEDFYPSHSAIVVAFEERNGVNHAVTVGGNEGNTVGKTFHALKANGKLHTRDPHGELYVCVVENQLARASVVPILGRFRVIARPELNLRGGPGTNFPIKGALAAGTELHVVEFVGGGDDVWAFVDLEGDGMRDGCVFAKFIERVG